MRKFLALVAFLAIVIASTCCAPRAAPVAKSTTGPAAPEVFVRPSRFVVMTIHVDMAFTGPGRVLIVEAAERWSRLTRSRAEIDLVFDLTPENLPAHVAAGDSVLVGILADSDMGEKIDNVLDNGDPLSKPVAATIVPQSRRPILVFLIVDRIPAAKFLAVVTHELGHVLGLPDLEAQGAIMSGSAKEDDAPVEDFTPADVALCRESYLCD